MQEAIRISSNPVEAIGEIKRHVAEYLERDGVDREVEDLALAERFSLDPEKVKSLWAKSRKQRTEREAIKLPVDKPKGIGAAILSEVQKAEASFFEPKVQPSVEEPKAIPKEVAKVPVAGLKARAMAVLASKPKIEEKPRRPGIGPSPNIKPKPRIEATSEKGPLTSWPKEWPEAPLPPPNASAYERLLYPKGLLGHAVQYIVDTAGLPDRKLSLAVALSACGKGLDRKVIGPSGNSTILYILVIAETGAGKQHGLGGVRALLRAMGLEHCYAASGLASIQSIEEIIEGIPNKIDPNPNPLIVIDEVGSWLSRILSAKQLGNVDQIPAHLQIMWGLPVEEAWIGTKRREKEMQTFFSVAFAILGFSTEQMFFRAIKDKHIHSGFVNRMMMFNVGRGAEERVDPKYGLGQMPEWLVNAFRRVTNLDVAPLDTPMKLVLPTGDGPVVLRDFYRPDWKPEVKEAARALEKQFRTMPSVEDRELWIRTHDIALRLATIHNHYRCSGVMEMLDWQWAVDLATHSTKELRVSVDRHSLDALEDADLAERVRDYVRAHKHRCVTIGELHKHLEKKVNDIRKIDTVIWHVVKTGDILEVPPEEAKADPRGKPTTYFQWGRSK